MMEVDHRLLPAGSDRLHHLMNLDTFRSRRVPPTERLHRLLEPPVRCVWDRFLESIESRLVLILFHVENLHLLKKLLEIVGSLSLPLSEEFLHPVSHTVSFSVPHAGDDCSLCPQMLDDEKRGHMLPCLRVDEGFCVSSEDPVLVNFSLRIELLQQYFFHIWSSIYTNLNTTRSDLRMLLPLLHEVVHVVDRLRELLLLMVDHHLLLGLKWSQEATLEQSLQQSSSTHRRNEVPSIVSLAQHKKTTTMILSSIEIFRLAVVLKFLQAVLACHIFLPPEEVTHVEPTVDHHYIRIAHQRGPILGLLRKILAVPPFLVFSPELTGDHTRPLMEIEDLLDLLRSDLVCQQ